MRLLFFLFFTIITHSQTISGTVADENNAPLESANIIAFPKSQEKAQLKFAISDNLGRYKLELEKNINYEITVSYIGFFDEVFVYESNSTSIEHNFRLKATGEQLKEIIITHDFKPIEIKKDTLTYTLKAFVNGNERKMKEVLEKLPGVEVDKKGNVFVQGKKITKMLVEGKSFFGGGSKLAVENIPADALEKIEVIDHFNEVGFMKQVSDSDDLAMNVKLKENKKKFVFGDIEVGAEVADDNGYYLAHSGLFYYAPKTNFSFIGDLNNIGKSTFTFEDLMRFEGGSSSFLTKRKSLTNLFEFLNDNTDVILNKSQFSAINFSFDTSPKLIISGFGIFSNVAMKSQIDSKNEYLQNSNISFENSLQKNSTKTLLGIANIKLDYSPNTREKWYYNSQFQSDSNSLINELNSTTNVNSTAFETLSDADNISLKQFVEWHKSYNERHSTTFVVNQSYEKKTPTNKWFTNQPFLSGLIPLQTDSDYSIEQIKKIKNNSIDALFKQYWIINDYNHLYTNLGNNFINSNFETSERQVLTNGMVNDFSDSGFGNAVKYQLNDTYLGIEYKFKIGKWTNKPGIYLHRYQLKTLQIANTNSISKTVFQPQFNSNYEFNKSETLDFNYKLTNDFPDVTQMSNQFTLQSYNSVFKGNTLLENEQFHAANLSYSKRNLYRGVFWNARTSFTKKVKTIRNSIELSGINQYSTPIFTENPETNWRFSGSVSKKVYRFSLKINSNLNWFNYLQTINNLTIRNDRNNQNIGFSIKTAHKKWPDFSIGYNKGYTQFTGIGNSNYQSDKFVSDVEFSFFKFFTFSFDYENLKNTNNANQSNYYDIANLSLRYQKKDSPFGFELLANNLFNNMVKYDYTFSDYIITDRTTYVLPRVFMLAVNYKL